MRSEDRRYLLVVVVLYAAVLVAVVAAHVTGNLLPAEPRPAVWVTPSPYGPPPEGWAER